MKLKQLRDAMERIKDNDGEMEVEFGSDPVIDGDRLYWTNTPIEAVYQQEVEGPIMLMSHECSDAVQKKTSSSTLPGYGLHIVVDKSLGFVGITRQKLDGGEEKK